MIESEGFALISGDLRARFYGAWTGSIARDRSNTQPETQTQTDGFYHVLSLLLAGLIGLFSSLSEAKRN